MSAALKLAEPEHDGTPCLSDCDPLRALLEETAEHARMARGDCEVAEAALLVALRRAQAARERLVRACGLVEMVAKELGRR